jgi:transglutaminase-like putative cysteine protease
LAANGLKSFNLMRAQKPEKLVTLLLLFIMLTAVAAGLSSVLSAPDWDSLWRGLIIGLLIGTALAIFQQPPLGSILIIALTGVSYALLYSGGLGQKLYDLVTGFLLVIIRIATSPLDLNIDLTSINQLLVDLFNTSVVIIGRVSMWVNALAIGEPTFDPVATAFVWILLIWIAAAWAGWIALAHRNVLLAILPVLLLSIGTLSYGQRDSFSLYLMLGTTLLLLATVQHDRREQGWEELNTAYPPRKGRQIGISAFFVSIMLVLLAAIISSISIPRIVEWVSSRSQPVVQREGNLAESLGIVAGITASADIFQDVRRPGLPRDLLIGSAPDLSKRIVMSVAVDDYLSIFKGESPQPLYWRSLTYDTYTGRGWQTSDTTQSQYQANQLLQPEKAPHRILIKQIVHPIGSKTSLVYAAGEPVGINHFTDAAWRSSGDLFGIVASGHNSIETRSLISVANEQALRAEGQKYPDWVRQRFLYLPSDVPSRVKELALQLTAAESTPYDRVKAIERYLRTIPYTLDVPYPPLDQDLVDFFLFDLRKGYCDYYASAMVVLARASGVPARFVIGYANGEYDLKSKRFLVSEADAHSWVEVYFPNAGWVPFEPTAGRPPMEKSKGSTFEFSSSLTIPEESPYMEQASSRPSWWILLLSLIASIGICCTAWVAFDEIRMHRLLEPAVAVEVYRRMRRYGKRLNVTSGPGETPYEYAVSLNSNLQELSQIKITTVFNSGLFEEISSITNRIVETSFRPAQYQDKYEKLIFHQWRGLRWRLGLMWMMNYYQLFRDRLSDTLAGAVSNKNGVVEQE